MPRTTLTAAPPPSACTRCRAARGPARHPRAGSLCRTRRHGDYRELRGVCGSRARGTGVSRSASTRRSARVRICTGTRGGALPRGRIGARSHAVCNRRRTRSNDGGCLPIHGTPAPAHFATPESAAVAPQDDEPVDRTTEEPATPNVNDPSNDADTVSPGDTAEIDVAAVEAKLKDPGSTMSFEPLTDERIETDSTYDAGTTTQLMWGARSDVGCVRPHNEDSYLVQSPLFCVCDGMGGHAAGEVASSIAVETIAKTAPQAADAARLAAAVEAANAAVIEAAPNGLGKPGMGCTGNLRLYRKRTLAIAHVGDSRAYLLHEGTLIRVTRDHSYVEELVDAGEITADEARVHPNRSVITRALGSDPAMYADHFTLHIEEGDRLILCSDGLSSMIPDSDIENIATQSSTAQICVDNLVDAALAAGGHDNVTVVVVDLVDDGVMREAKRVRRRNITIATVLGIVFVLAAGIWAYAGVTGSYYLGTYKGTVAV